MNAPAGIIVGWPDTEASISAGWARVAGLDGKYLRGNTVAGGTGGATTHTHAGQSHNHVLADHTHTQSGTVGNGNAALNCETYYYLAANFIGANDSAHDHTITGSTGVPTSKSCTSVAHTITAAASNPPYWLVIWIKADGSTPIPAGALAWGGRLLSGWTQPVTGEGRYLKGAAAGGGGGATGGAASHVHTQTHTHTLSHGHTGGSTNYSTTTTGVWADFAGATLIADYWHTHTFVWTTSNQTSGADVHAAESESARPRNWQQYCLQQGAGGGIPRGLIVAWDGAAGAIPIYWRACDGTGGVPNLNDVAFLLGGPDAGTALPTAVDPGWVAHTHVLTAHLHTQAGHTHTSGSLTGVNFIYNTYAGPPTRVGMTTHTHPFSGASTNSVVTTVSNTGPHTSGSGDFLPPYTDVIFIHYVGPLISLGAVPVRPDDEQVALLAVPSAVPAQPLDLIDLDGAWTRQHFYPDLSAVAPAAEGPLGMCRRDAAMVIGVLETIPGPVEIGLLTRDLWTPAGTIPATAGGYYQVALQPLPGGLLLAMVLAKPAAVYAWYQAVGQWNAGTQVFDWTTPPIASGFAISGDAINVPGALRRLPDGSVLFAWLWDFMGFTPAYIHQCYAMPKDASGTWGARYAGATDVYDLQIEIVPLPGGIFLVLVLRDVAGVYRWQQSVGQINRGTHEIDFVALVECDTDPAGSFPNSANTAARAELAPDGGVLFHMIDDFGDYRLMKCAAMPKDATGTWEEK